MNDDEKGATIRCDKLSIESLSMHAQSNKLTSGRINDQKELDDATPKGVEQISSTNKNMTVTSQGPCQGTSNELKNVSKHVD